MAIDKLGWGLQRACPTHDPQTRTWGEKVKDQLCLDAFLPGPVGFVGRLPPIAIQASRFAPRAVAFLKSGLALAVSAATGFVLGRGGSIRDADPVFANDFTRAEWDQIQLEAQISALQHEIARQQRENENRTADPRLVSELDQLLAVYDQYAHAAIESRGICASAASEKTAGVATADKTDEELNADDAAALDRGSEAAFRSLHDGRMLVSQFQAVVLDRSDWIFESAISTAFSKLRGGLPRKPFRDQLDSDMAVATLRPGGVSGSVDERSVGERVRRAEGIAHLLVRRGEKVPEVVFARRVLGYGQLREDDGVLADYYAWKDRLSSSYREIVEAAGQTAIGKNNNAPQALPPPPPPAAPKPAAKPPPSRSKPPRTPFLPRMFAPSAVAVLGQQRFRSLQTEANKPGPLVDKTPLGRLLWMEEYADWLMDNDRVVTPFHFKKRVFERPDDTLSLVADMQWEVLLRELDDGRRSRAITAFRLATGK